MGVLHKLLLSFGTKRQHRPFLPENNQKLLRAIPALCLQRHPTDCSVTAGLCVDYSDSLLRELPDSAAAALVHEGRR